MDQLRSEGHALHRKLICLPDEVKNGPAPLDLQEQFNRWRGRLLETGSHRSRGVVDTEPAYVQKLTVRLLAYKLELIIRGI
jgi:hypothetical protein